MVKAASSIPQVTLNEYVKLRAHFNNRPFTADEASTVLGKPKDTTLAILNRLATSGLLDVVNDPKTPGAKLYSLKPVPVTRGDLETILKKAADLIRTRVDYSFILVLLFYKRISDQWKLEHEAAKAKLIRQGYPPEEAERLAKEEFYHRFNIPEEYLWDNVVKRKDKLLHESFSEALKKLGEQNQDLQPIFDNFDFHQFTSKENSEILRQLVELFDSVPLIDVSPDILGDAYEWLLTMFAPEKAKEGEIFTPREVIKLLVSILDPKPGDKILDPAAGSGGMLIAAYKYVEEKHGRDEADKLFLYGQEYNHRIAALAKMNMYIHDIDNHKIEVGDSLLYPKFDLETYDIVMANPPWNQDGYNEEVLKKNEKYRQIYRYGYTPKQSADWAWIQLMLAAAKPGGKIGVVIDQGALFRGGSEKTIRSKIVDNDLIETVILLPEKLFYNTGAPGVILILNKNKPPERRGKILFINASQLYEKHPEVRRLNRLGNQHISKIVEVYKNYREEPGLSRIVTLDEVRKNDYNLNVTLYVTPLEESEKIDIEKEWSELKKLEEETRTLLAKIETWVTEITRALRE